MSKKKLHGRLESLFQSLNENLTAPPREIPVQTPELVWDIAPDEVYAQSGDPKNPAYQTNPALPELKPWQNPSTLDAILHQPVSLAGQDNTALLTVPFQIRDRGTGLLEIVDDTNPDRAWSEDERMLAKEVANQLALALENAELYQTVQQELKDRIRAEAETTERNQDLAILNQAGQQLSKLATPTEIYQLLGGIVTKMTGCETIAIARYDTPRRLVSYPVRKTTGTGALSTGQAEPLGNDLAGYLFWTRQPLLIQQDAIADMFDKGIVLAGRLPKSVLAIPLLAGERITGAILLQDFEKEKAFTPIQIELLSTLAAQAATALENAALFQEIRSALTAIEVRERYQANVAIVAATLSKYGSKSLPEVLALLGEAAGAAQVIYAHPLSNSAKVGWQIEAEWITPDHAANTPSRRYATLSADSSNKLVQDLKKSGWLVQKASDLTSIAGQPMSSIGCSSSLLLAVPGKGEFPGFIQLEDISGDREWKEDEIRILQIATDALSNTLLREGLLKQVQINLHETENLYHLSHSLALAVDLEEMITSFASGIQVQGLQRAILVNLNQNGRAAKRWRVAATWYSGDGALPPIQGYEYPSETYESLFSCPAPVFYNEPAEYLFDYRARAEFLKQGVRSLALLPLWTGRKQTGVLLLLSQATAAFTEQVCRSFPPLVDQMSTSIENIRLFNETQAALADTGLLYKVSDAISQAAEPADLVKVIVDHLLPVNADQATLILINTTTENIPNELEVVSSFDARESKYKIGVRFNYTALPMLQRVDEGMVAVPDVRISRLDPATKQALHQLGIVGACFIPLRSAGRLAGLLVISSHEAAQFSEEDMRLLNMASSGFAVALEKYRLLNEARRRAIELQTAAEISRDTASTLASDELLNNIVHLVCDRFNYDHASVFLLDSSGQYAVVRESSGQAGQTLKQRSYLLEVGSKSVIGQVTATGQPVIISDVAHSDIYFSNPLLPETRSEMALPLKLDDKVIGALDLQSNRVNAFNPNEVTVLQILADQIAVAIENARSYEMAQKAVEEMREVDRLKSQFLANMSHELRTPLNSIIGFSRVILKGIDGEINETQQQDLTSIYNSGQHLLNLINDILDLSKIEAGKMELSISEVSIGEMIHSAMSTATGLVKGKPIRLNQIVPKDLPTVKVDSMRVRQVLINFLSNAAKFTEEGVITVEAKTSAGPAGEPEILITVTDTGPGIAAEDEKKLFQPFSQVDDSPTRKTGGTGLGLSICKSLIDLHGGRIGLYHSEVGIGSTFFFTLPLPTNQEDKPVPLENLETA